MRSAARSAGVRETGGLDFLSPESRQSIEFLEVVPASEVLSASESSIW